MRLLLDECLPRKLKREFTGHQVSTVPEMGWAGTKNGELLSLADGVFDVFVTTDQNMPHQQNLRDRTVSVLILVAPDNRLDTLIKLVPGVQETLKSIGAGEFAKVGE